MIEAFTGLVQGVLLLAAFGGLGLVVLGDDVVMAGRARRRRERQHEAYVRHEAGRGVPTPEGWPLPDHNPDQRSA